MENGKYKPFRKPNDTPLYVNTGSSHPQTVLKQIPHGINKRLVEISSSETDFNEAKPAYQKALNESKHKHTLEFKQEEPIRPRNNNKKKRRIFWFNPPFSAAVTTNIGKQFLALVDKHFPKTNPLHAIFNRNTMKLSYSCTMNVKAIIQAHNKKLLNKTKKAAKPPHCNCQKRVKHLCPMPGKGNRFNVIYQATTREENPKKYIGSTKGFKSRYSTHKVSFKNDSKNQTALSKHLWETNQQGENPNLKWEILMEATPYQPGSRSCNLCLTEKLLILKNSQNPCYLNKRTELAQRCRHIAEWRLDKLL